MMEKNLAGFLTSGIQTENSDMKKKERIAELEKNLEELRQRVMMLDSKMIHDLIYPVYPWTDINQHPPTITWSNKTDENVLVGFGGVA